MYAPSTEPRVFRFAYTRELEEVLSDIKRAIADSDATSDEELTELAERVFERSADFALQWVERRP